MAKGVTPHPARHFDTVSILIEFEAIEYLHSICIRNFEDIFDSKEINFSQIISVYNQNKIKMLHC